MDDTDSEPASSRVARRTRRKFLLGFGVTSAVAVAGCNGSTDGLSTETEQEATASSEPTAGVTSTPGDSGSVQPVVLTADALETLELAATSQETIEFTLPEES